MGTKTLRQEAQEIIDKGNGWGVPLCELIKIESEERRKAVWREIVQIGMEQGAHRDTN